MRPGSVALLPVSTASTGLLCLSIGAHVHRGRSDTEVSVWLLLCAYHIWCMTILGVPGWVPIEDTQPKVWVKACLSCDPSHLVWTAGTTGKGNTLSHQRVFSLDPYVHAQAGIVCATLYLGGKDGLG